MKVWHIAYEDYNNMLTSVAQQLLGFAKPLESHEDMHAGDGVILYCSRASGHQGTYLAGIMSEPNRGSSAQHIWQCLPHRPWRDLTPIQILAYTPNGVDARSVLERALETEIAPRWPVDLTDRGLLVDNRPGPDDGQKRGKMIVSPQGWQSAVAYLQQNAQ